MSDAGGDVKEGRRNYLGPFQTISKPLLLRGDSDPEPVQKP
jgi:hypothetical protein